MARCTQGAADDRGHALPRREQRPHLPDLGLAARRVERLADLDLGGAGDPALRHHVLARVAAARVLEAVERGVDARLLRGQRLPRAVGLADLDQRRDDLLLRRLHHRRVLLRKAARTQRVRHGARLAARSTRAARPPGRPGLLVRAPHPP
jgi:hypothetical protein